MKHAVNVYSALTLLFVGMLAVSGSLAGALSEIVYILAFILPVILGLVSHRELKRRREEERGVAEVEWCGLSLNAADAMDLAILAPAIIGLIFLAAALTSLLLTSLGAEDTPIVREHFAKMLLVHAVLPAILEELLFRYLPMKLVAPYSRRWCIILSSVYFALIHPSLFKMPYALLAGVIFIGLDIAADSILPSLILHFLNNLLSLVWVCYCQGGRAQTVFLVSLGAASALSVAAAVCFRRRRILAKVKALKDCEVCRLELGRGPIAVLAVCLLSALLMLL